MRRNVSPICSNTAAMHHAGKHAPLRTCSFSSPDARSTLRDSFIISPLRCGTLSRWRYESRGRPPCIVGATVSRSTLAGQSCSHFSSPGFYFVYFSVLEHINIHVVALVLFMYCTDTWTEKPYFMWSFRKKYMMMMMKHEQMLHRFRHSIPCRLYFCGVIDSCQYYGWKCARLSSSC